MVRIQQQQSPSFLAPGTRFMEDKYSKEWGRWWRWFWDDSSALHLLYTLCLLLLYQLQLRKWSHSVMSDCDLMDYSLPGSSVHGDSPGKNTGVGCYFLLQGIFLTQGSNSSLLLCRQTLYPLSHQRSSLFLLLLYQLQLRSWGIRSQRLGIPVL